MTRAEKEVISLLKKCLMVLFLILIVLMYQGFSKNTKEVTKKRLEPNERTVSY
jgi:hypothetical protein